MKTATATKPAHQFPPRPRPEGLTVEENSKLQTLEKQISAFLEAIGKSESERQVHTVEATRIRAVAKARHDAAGPEAFNQLLKELDRGEYSLALEGLESGQGVLLPAERLRLAELDLLQAESEELLALKSALSAVESDFRATAGGPADRLRKKPLEELCAVAVFNYSETQAELAELEAAMAGLVARYTAVISGPFRRGQDAEERLLRALKSQNLSTGLFGGAEIRLLPTADRAFDFMHKTAQAVGGGAGGRFQFSGSGMVGQKIKNLQERTFLDKPTKPASLQVPPQLFGLESRGNKGRAWTTEEILDC